MQSEPSELAYRVGGSPYLAKSASHFSAACSISRHVQRPIATAISQKWLIADWCNSARGFMFALGCIQAQSCHTNTCPVGVTTQDKSLARALVPADKATRVRNYHANTIHALAEVLGAAGLSHSSELRPRHVVQRLGPNHVETYDQLYEYFETGQLLEGRASAALQRFWDLASPKSFQIEA